MKEVIVMVRVPLLVAATLLAAPAFADPPGTVLQSGNGFPAAADKVYPPLPTLAMLPPSSGSDDDLPVKPTPHRKKSRVPRLRATADRSGVGQVIRQRRGAHPFRRFLVATLSL
jgi:hypothetical protein